MRPRQAGSRTAAVNCNIYPERLACSGLRRGAARDPTGQRTSPGADHIRPHIAKVVVFLTFTVGYIERGIHVEFSSMEKS